MAGKSILRSAKKKAKIEPEPVLDVHIDYPREEELVIPGHYAIRISGAPEAQIEISLNNGEWIGCRTAVGFYWHDWEPTASGEYTLVARQKIGKGRAKKSDTRFFRVVGKKG